MTILNLTLKEVKLLLRVHRAGYLFYENVYSFLKEHENGKDEITLEVEGYEFEDIIDSIQSYLDEHDVLEEQDLVALLQKID